MKWMGWGCEQYDAAPTEIINEICRMINEEAEEIRRIQIHGS